MGKLNIAHHKSYHPYRRDNIEKVRRDEEAAKLKEAQEEGRVLLANSEARIDLLRERAGLGSGSNNAEKRQTEIPVSTLTTSDGHINFFEDLEQNAIATAMKATKQAKEPSETDKGVPLAPSVKDLNPWYTAKDHDTSNDDSALDERRKRDIMRKSGHDPLTDINQRLASTSRPSGSSSFRRPRPPSPSRFQNEKPEVSARLSRESSERERALELIRRKQRERMTGSETPSTAYGGDDEYGDMYNRREVQEAHRGRDKRGRRREESYRHRRW